MPLVDQLRSRLLLAATVCGAALGTAIGLFLPIRAATPEQGAELAWRLPTAESVRRFNEASYQSVRSGGFWGGEAQRNRATRASGWTLRAIMTRPVSQVAVAVRGSNAQVWVRVGDALPDGGTLVAVDRDKAWVEQEGCRRAVFLYAAQGKASGEGEAGGKCANGATQPVPSASARSGAASGKTNLKEQ